MADSTPVSISPKPESDLSIIILGILVSTIVLFLDYSLKSLVSSLCRFYHYRDECRALAECLEIIQPSLKNISARCRRDPALEKWIDDVKDYIQDARVILEKSHKSERSPHLVLTSTCKYVGKVPELRARMEKVVTQAPLVLLAFESSTSRVITQDVPGKIFGMEDYFKRVKSAVCEGHNKESSSCVGIRGMGGAGKTLLAQMVNNDKKIQEIFGKDSVIWITVGRHASVSKIYNRMRNHLQVHGDGGSLEDQRRDLMNVFVAARALLILDDVWDGCIRETKDMLYWLNIAKGPSCITLITTRDELVTRKCVNVGEEIVLRLSQEQSWQLFCTHAFDTEPPILDEDLEAMARNICKECDGLPLALRVIGCVMNGRSDWGRMLRHLQASTMLNESIEQQLYGCLRTSYDVLDGLTKICFLVFAIFPKHYEVQVKQLCQIWVDEGLFGGNLSEEEALQEAHGVVEELVRRSLIEVSKVDGGGAPERIKMHVILRNLAIQLVSKGNDALPQIPESASLRLLDRGKLSIRLPDFTKLKELGMLD